MKLKDLKLITKTNLNYLLAGAIVGALFGSIEYFAKINTKDELDFFPLIARAAITSLFIIASVIIFEQLFKNGFKRKRFLYLVLTRAFFYTLIISLWLFIINGIWFSINGNSQFQYEMINYLIDDMYLINLSSIFIVLVIALGLGQINSLHRKRELLNFVLGRYNTPREVERIFCFIDLKGSTTIAEKLGHLQFVMFLRDYYSDITDAIRQTDAQIYQYVGDEIILSWSYKNGLKNNNLVRSFFLMKRIINGLKQDYLDKYGDYPEFRAGLHGGKVIVTWVGELKKEIVYIGDVLNTTARIQEDTKRLGKEFLVSDELVSRMNGMKGFKATFIEETVPRGKEQQVKLYSLEEVV